MNSTLLSSGDLGAIIAAAGDPIIAAFRERISHVEDEVPGVAGETERQRADLLKIALQKLSVYLETEGQREEFLHTVWLVSPPGGHYTVQELRQAYGILRTAIFAQLPQDRGLSIGASALLSQALAISESNATENIVHDSVAVLLEQQVQRRSDLVQNAARRKREAVEIERVNFSNLFRHSPEMVCVLSGPEHHFDFVNEAHVKVLGFDATGKTVRAAQPESVEIHHILDNVYRTGKTAELHEIPVTVTDRLRYFNLTYAARRDAEGTIDGILILGTEITDQFLFRESNQLQQKALELALDNAPLEQVLDVLAKMVERQSGRDLLASILLIDEEGKHLVPGAAPSLPAAYKEAVHGLAIQPLVDEPRQPELTHVTVEAIDNEARWADFKKLAQSHGLRACWLAPILNSQGKLLGTFALYSRTSRKPTAHENQIVAIAARTTALIIGRRRAISERLANAEALRESEAELTFTLASAKLGTWSIDFTSASRVTLSAEAAGMLGCGSEHTDARTAIDECIHPEDRERVNRRLENTFATGTPYRDEFRVRWPSGEVRWLDARGRTRYDADGKLKALSGVLMDITEQKLAADNLYASKRMLELAASGGRIGFWHVNLARGSFDPDEKMAADWGIDLTTFPRTFDAGMAVVHPEDRGIITTGIANALAGTEVYDKEFRIILPSGEERWILSKGEFYADESGKRNLFSGVSIDITDKKLGLLAQQRIADVVAAEREKLEQVLEQTAVPTALLEGPNHVFSFVNSAYLQTFQLDSSITGKPVAEVLPDAIAQGFGDLLTEVFQTGKTFAGKEAMFEWKTATESNFRFLDFTYAAKRNAANRIEGVLATIVDVTDRVRLRQATEKANALLEAERFNLNEIVQASPAAIATWMGPRFVFDRVNPEYAKVFGNRPLVGRELLEACPELRGQGFDELLRHVLETGEPFVGNEVLAKISPTPGGPTEDRYFDFKYLRINDQDGNPYGVYDFAIDVTDRVLARRHLEESSDKLREAEGLLKRAIEVANIGFYEWDLSTNRITFSAQMQKDWGIEGGASLESVVAHIYPEERDRITKSISKAIGAEGTRYREEYRVRRPTDGKTVWIEAQGGLVADKHGKLTRFIGTSLDITQRKHTEEQLQAASLDARNASSAKSAFLANMSHEIRTPLGAIMGFAELLKKPDLTRTNSASFISVIERNSQHLLRIVDDILDLSKVEAGKMVFEHIEFSLPDLLSDFASLMGLRARDKGIDFALRITSAIPVLVISDPTRLRQILNNIVGNAIKFTERGLVELGVSYEDKLLKVQVKDTGRGISQEQVERLFQAFVQADESTTRKFGGTGLGLVLTKRLASAMGGDFYLQESTLDVGSVFVACVKVGIISGTRFVNNQTLNFSTIAEELVAPQRTMLAGMKLLVVDDSPDNRTLLSVMLQDAGATIESAKDGIQGVEMALGSLYDAVLMDIQMPRMDGYQAMEVLKGKGYTVPIIALTAHAMVEERERAKGKGFAAFMTKPIQRDSLLNLLDGLRRKKLSPMQVGNNQRAGAEGATSRSVLIVEDDADASEAMEIILGGLGLNVRCARAGQEVLTVLGEGFVPDLVLLDLTLPDMPGADVLKAIRREPSCAQTRIIVVSGWDNLEKRAQEIGADGALRKPINLKELKELVRRA